MAFARPSDTALYADDDAGHGRRRRRVFLLASLPVLALGLVYTVAQRPLYDSTATVLMSAPTAIDQQMLDVIDEADHVGEEPRQALAIGVTAFAATSQCRGVLVDEPGADVRSNAVGIRGGEGFHVRAGDRVGGVGGRHSLILPPCAVDRLAR